MKVLVTGGNMALSAVQKWGIALGFIPGVSTVVGAIKAFVYYRRASKHEKDGKLVHEMASKAKNIHEKALNVFKEQELRQIGRLEKNIGEFSLTEMIPVINIVAAILGVTDTDAYPALSEAQQNIQDLKDPLHSEERLKNYLIQRYDVKDNPNPALMEAMEWIFANVDDPSKKIYSGWHKFNILDEIPELVNKCREKIKDGETDTKKILASALTEIIDKRKKDEEIMKADINRTEAYRHVGLSEKSPQYLSHVLDLYTVGTTKLKDLLDLLLQVPG